MLHIAAPPPTTRTGSNKMRIAALLSLTLLGAAGLVGAFGPEQRDALPPVATTTRGRFLSVAAGSLLSAATAVAAPRASWAEVPAGGSFSKCVKEDGKTGKATNCVSTSNVKDVDLYSPPWTYEVSSDEAFARLKGAIAADSSLEVVESDKENRYLRVEAATPLFQGKDAVEFLLRGDEDKFVTFKSYGMEAGAITDAKSHRLRLESIRKAAGVFGVMGAGLTSDSYGDLSRGREGGFKAQLKSFYGLQSGAGFEDVLSEK